MPRRAASPRCSSHSPGCSTTGWSPRRSPGLARWSSSRATCRRSTVALRPRTRPWSTGWCRSAIPRRQASTIRPIRSRVGRHGAPRAPDDRSDRCRRPIRQRSCRPRCAMRARTSQRFAKAFDGASRRSSPSGARARSRPISPATSRPSRTSAATSRSRAASGCARCRSRCTGSCDGDEFIGEASIRHQLNAHLMQEGGHIGYGIRPSRRDRGYGKRILALALVECRRPWHRARAGDLPGAQHRVGQNHRGERRPAGERDRRALRSWRPAPLLDRRCRHRLPRQPGGRSPIQ